MLTPEAAVARRREVITRPTHRALWYEDGVVAEAAAESHRVKTEAEIKALKEREAVAKAYTTHPELLRLQELETLRELARTANARIYIGFDKHFNGKED